MISRRNFLRNSSLLSLVPTVPHLLGRSAHATPMATDDRVLVVIQLTGGNDGLNTVVPYADDGYGRVRKKLKIPTDKLLKLDDQNGLHPSMKAVKELFDQGQFSIVQGVGYPNPDRSHFRSMKIWQTASFDDQQHDNNGWLGRLLDDESFVGKKEAIFVGEQATPVALWGRHSEAVSMSRADDLQLSFRRPTGPIATKSNVDTAEDLRQFVAKQVQSAFDSAERFKRQSRGKSESNDASYPNTKLGSQLKLISQILKSGSNSRVLYTSQSGYDTHAAQLYNHTRLLREYSAAVKALMDDLQAAGLDDRVVVMTFSEFGRRVEENDSAGTDHGTAGPVFLAGSPIRGGLLGHAADLSNLVDGDLKVQHDFRSIYATLLENWLGVKAESVLGGTFEQLPFFA